MKRFIIKNRIVLLFGFILVAYMSYIMISQEIKHRELVADREAYLEEIGRLKNQIDGLEDLIEEISTPEHIEKMAREMLQMVKPDEIIYIIEDQSN